MTLMVRWLPSLLLSLAPAAMAAETMRISVGPESSKVVIGGSGLRVGPDAEEATYEPFSSVKVSLTRSAGRLLVDGLASPAVALRFRSGGEGGGVISVDGIQVKGDVVVALGKSQLVAVNVLPLEDYLVGVIGSEMPKSFPTEALRAQAIAARTYALRKKLEKFDEPYYLGSSVISQVYRGLQGEDQRTREAVESTRGLVVTWQLEPIEAYFHASCGGRTESGADALGRSLPYLQAVDCPCHQLPSSHWTVKLKAADLESLGARKGGMKIEGRSPTGRVRRLRIGERSLGAVTFRERLGYMRIKSLHFELEKAADGWKVSGRGFGHGAGLCQWGSRMYADKGWDYRKILLHYYPGTELQALYE